METNPVWNGMGDLPSYLQAKSPSERRVYGATFFDSEPKLSDYWIGKTPVQLYTYLLTLVNGGSKQKEPLTVVDPLLSAALNGRGYFSYSLGDVYGSQKTAAIAALAIRQVGTFLFAPVYNLAKATTRPRIWSLSLLPVREDGKWVMYGQAVMGHCTVWPVLPYELLGAIAICQLMVGETKLPFKGMQWLFHSLVVPSPLPQGWMVNDPDTAPMKLPSAAVTAELLAAERKLSRNPDVRPTVRAPLDAYGTKYLDTLQRVYKNTIRKEPANASTN